ncbi:type 1 glutamine amidotransferase domain-containing protein [Polluticaenibacter yanchengensis]|uniref:Type 1 glutamine amidotransferase domain-containing protein n=1 Tax=Polluticaenibacter yanchengensis TaxID=3014562 RepID=A0ABT4UQB3_9BACT|nr:type 1 glutamine amidotransferase domain-containing protein [Chitinophagaceae bacterium LY-5]
MTFSNNIAKFGLITLLATIIGCNNNTTAPKNKETNTAGQTATPTPKKDKILFVVTSHDTKGSTGEKTGYYLGEVSHPWEVLTTAGYQIDFVSPKGGNPPVDGFDLTDSTNKKFWEDPYYHQKISNSLKPAYVKPADYVAIYYAGGHGAMWDLPNDTAIAAIAAKIYQNNGIVAAVCHGPAGLINIKLSNGKYLVEGKKVNGFSNQEEEAVKLTKIVPFLLEDQLKARGGIYEKSAPWQVHVTKDDRLITGQNPQSAKEVGQAIKETLQK